MYNRSFLAGKLKLHPQLPAMKFSAVTFQC